MRHTDGDFPNDSQGVEEAVSTLFHPEAQSEGHEPPIVVGVVDIPAGEDPAALGSKELPGNNPTSEPEAPPLPPKESKATSYTCYPRNMIGKMKKGLGARDRERQGTKDSYYSSNHRQRTQSQEVIINNLERRLEERDVHIRDLEGLIDQYRKQVQAGEALKQELSSVRKHLRLGDEDEPWVIEKSFGEINKRVEDISVKFSTTLGDGNARRELNTFDLLEQLLIHQGYERKASVESAYTIEPDEFIELGCRSLLNGLLIETVLNPKIFNPEWDPSTNDLFHKMYQTVQQNDAQVNAGRWRISTFKTIPNDVRRYCEIHAERFFDDILVLFCQTAYDAELCSAAKGLVFPDIVGLMERAYAWNYHSRSTILMLDFEAVYFPPGDDFDGSFSELERSKIKSPTSETILLTTRLGLRSFKALGDGKLECVCQSKAVVSWNGYFHG